MLKKWLFMVIVATLLFGCEEQGILTDDFNNLITDATKQVEQISKDSLLDIAKDVVQDGLVEDLINSGQELLNDSLNNQESFDTEEPTDDQEAYVPATVYRHVDGDTSIFKILDNYQHDDSNQLLAGQEIRVRYLLINAPEITKGKNEPFGQEALELVAQVATPGETVFLEFDESLYDPYGRLLAYIYLEDGRMLNEMLLEKGFAKVTVYEPNKKYEDRFRQIEENAKAKGLGIWSLQ